MGLEFSRIALYLTGHLHDFAEFPYVLPSDP